MLSLKQNIFLTQYPIKLKQVCMDIVTAKAEATTRTGLPHTHTNTPPPSTQPLTLATLR